MADMHESATAVTLVGSVSQLITFVDMGLVLFQPQAGGERNWSPLGLLGRRLSLDAGKAPAFNVELQAQRPVLVYLDVGFLEHHQSCAQVGERSHRGRQARAGPGADRRSRVVDGSAA